MVKTLDIGVQKFIWLMVGLFAWELVVQTGSVDKQLMPSLLTILKRTTEGILHGDLLIQLMQSIGYVIGGVALGLLLAFLMAVLSYYNIWMNSLFTVYSSVLHPLPGVAVLPIVILWFGLGSMAVFIVVLHAVVWSQYLTLKEGFDAIEEEYIEAAHNNGAGKWQLVIHVLLPMSVNAILLGLQIGWSRGWRALISAEMIFGAIGTVGGIGWYMYERRAFMDTAGVFSGILLVMVVGMVMEQLVFNQWLKGLYRK